MRSKSLTRDGNIVDTSMINSGNQGQFGGDYKKGTVVILNIRFYTSFYKHILHT